MGRNPCFVRERSLPRCVTAVRRRHAPNFSQDMVFHFGKSSGIGDVGLEEWREKLFDIDAQPHDFDLQY